jgi:hypothetical protein
MKFAQFIAALALLLVTTGIAAKQEKTVICHVGNEAGPNGETYLDNPAYDAGKIDLIVVAKAARHLAKEHHCWDGICDYLPADVNATGYGTEDSNGDGVDDGCEPVDECPCWDAFELTSVTAENQDSLSCSSVPPSEYPTAMIANIEGSTPQVEGGFLAYVYEDLVSFAVCITRDYNFTQELYITAVEGFACIAQIAARCAAIGDPIDTITPP